MKSNTHLARAQKTILALVGAAGILAITGCEPVGRISVREDHSRLMQTQVAEKAQLEAERSLAISRLADAERTIQKQQATNEKIERDRTLWRSSSAILIVLAGLTLFAGAILENKTKKEASA